MTVLEEKTMYAIQSINQKLPDLELRDLFAMNIANGICGSYTNGTPWDKPELVERIALWSYSQADAMMRARRQKNGK